jgi:orotidine-5'-phosphate decarboxylase
LATHFSDRIYDAVKEKKTPLIVGLDPVYSRLPKSITTHKDMNDENDVSAAIDAIFEFSTKVLRIVAPLVPAVKMNIAFFEKYLWEGVEMYYNLVSEAESLGVEIIGDVKRGDIGHTAQEYAIAHLKNSDFTGLEDVVMPDAITINGFAGIEGIEPFAKVAVDEGKGIFVWVRSSNPSSAVIQDFADAKGVKMYQKLAEVIAQIANQPEYIGTHGFSDIGMIIGGTSSDETTLLRQKYPNIWFLVPGFGSQGATAQDCARLCKKDGTGALVNASRSIIYAYENPKYANKYGDNWEKCIEQAIADAKIELFAAIR